MECEYDTFKQYVSSANTLKKKIEAIDKVIDALLETAIGNAEDANTHEYWLDDGQTKIKQMYNDPNKLHQAVSGWEKMRNVYKNRLNGRSTIMISC